MNQQSEYPIVIGIIGGVASGKSTLTELLQKRGAKVIRADAIGHDVLKEPVVIQQLRELFGDGIFSDSGSAKGPAIDRKKLAVLVFGNSGEPTNRRKQLEAIVHPRIREIAKTQLQSLRLESGLQYIVLDAPLLIEGGWLPYCNKVVFVETAEELRQAWATSRGWSLHDWQQRESAQLSLELKRSHATDILINLGDLASLEVALDKMLDRWKKMRPAGS
jgi:dephospho-CoA kinase